VGVTVEKKKKKRVGKRERGLEVKQIAAGRALKGDEGWCPWRWEQQRQKLQDDAQKTPVRKRKRCRT